MKMTAEQFDNPKYFRDLEKWLNEASLWQNMLGFFPYAAAAAAGAGAFQAGTAPAAAAHQTSAPAASNVAPETLQGVQGTFFTTHSIQLLQITFVNQFLLLSNRYNLRNSTIMEKNCGWDSGFYNFIRL